ncbi:MAG: FAD-dependent oxidoreductase [Limnohabitans sp.]
MKTVSSWGRLTQSPHRTRALQDRQRAPDQIHGSLPGLAHGAGRSYGDVALNAGGQLWMTSGLDKLIGFDAEQGILECEAGVLLKDIQDTFVPRGWMLAVTPGTQWVTVGGAIANDVHGKNHHRQGSFGDHVLTMTLARTDGQCLQLHPQDPLFIATVGGLGLTGVILSVRLRLQKVPGPWLQTNSQPFHGLDAFFALSRQADANWEYTVAWVDCLAQGQPRGIFMCANHALTPEGGPARKVRPNRGLPLTPPFSLVNTASLKLFNEVYFRINARRSGDKLQHYQQFFYPLDGLQDWNRMYGPAGFYQYQCVLPPATAREGLQALLDEISESREGSFLAVLKTFGERRSMGMLGFPRPGVTLALDFPNRGPSTQALLDRLDGVVQACGGTLYLAKDARMPRPFFEQAYPRHAEFSAFRDPGISSEMSRRLLGN